MANAKLLHQVIERALQHARAALLAEGTDCGETTMTLLLQDAMRYLCKDLQNDSDRTMRILTATVAERASDNTLCACCTLKQCWAAAGGMEGEASPPRRHCEACLADVDHLFGWPEDGHLMAPITRTRAGPAAVGLRFAGIAAPALRGGRILRSSSFPASPSAFSSPPPSPSPLPLSPHMLPLPTSPSPPLSPRTQPPSPPLSPRMLPLPQSSSPSPIPADRARYSESHPARSDSPPSHPQAPYLYLADGTYAKLQRRPDGSFLALHYFNTPIGVVRFVERDEGSGGAAVQYVWEPLPNGVADSHSARPECVMATRVPPPSPALSDSDSDGSLIMSDTASPPPSLASSDYESDSSSSSSSSLRTGKSLRRSRRFSPYARMTMKKLPHEDAVDDIVPDVRAMAITLDPRVKVKSEYLEPEMEMAFEFAATRASDDALFADSSSSSESEAAASSSDGEHWESDSSSRWTRARPRRSPRFNPLARTGRRITSRSD